MDTTASVVAELNVALGTSYRVVRQLTGGLQSTAYELTGGVVLKWTGNPAWAPRVRKAAELVRRARAVGYPTPAWLAVGTTAAGSPYQLQEFVPGSAPTLDAGLARQVIDVCELQRDLIPEDHEVTWSGWSHGVVFDGWDGVWERVAGYDDEATELLRRYGELCGPYRDHALPHHDFVHGDLNMGNLLVADGQITGIIDIEAAGSGARAYDLVSLSASAARDGAAAGVDELFLEAALQANGRAATAICAAAAFASVAEFVHDRPTYAQEMVNHGGRRILDLLGA
ncbi:aminoglycoside phosphotransferase family protein [Kribbella sp. NPDC003557]|uniref:phosphotransferase family protein n=1 Tax=Kribbella sp. NPDC003557 TaxID=3154449 RepID=UPI0033B58D8C